MRIAFVTNEFVIEKPDAGGLGNYLNRMSRILKQQGHEVEIFVTRFKRETPELMDYDGIRVQHVPIRKDRIYRFVRKFDKRFIKSPWDGLADYFGIAKSLAKALEARHTEAPFDFVQSTNCAASGLFLKKHKDCLHVVRLSSIRELGLETDGLYNGIGAKLLVWLEDKSVARGDLIYSPSKYTADYYHRTKNKQVHVLRPPFFMEHQPADVSNYQLPSRYFIHFGSIGPVKGSDLLAEALVQVWKQAPDFSMVWAGKERKKGEMDRYRSLWGEFANRVMWFEGFGKQDLYSIIQQSDAAVLPSMVDNLPNTVIETLFLGTPVIGFNGASVDELVVHGESGALVEPGNVNELADAILKAWQHQNNWLANGFKKPQVLDLFAPEVAAANLVKLVEEKKKQTA